MKVKKQIQMIKAQLYLALQRRGFWCSFAVLMGFNALCYLEDVKWALTGDALKTMRPTDYFSLAIWRDGLAIFPILFPILIVLPVAFYAGDEEKEELGIYSIARNGYACYYRAKLAAVWLSNAILMWVSFGIQILWNCLTFKNWNNGYEGNLYSEMYFLSKNILFLDCYQIYPLLHQIIYVFFLGIFAGICGLFAYSIAIYLQKYKILCLIPVYVLFFCSRALQITGFVMDDYLVWPEYTKQIEGAWLVAVMLLILSLILLHWYEKKRNRIVC